MCCQDEWDCQEDANQFGSGMMKFKRKMVEQDSEDMPEFMVAGLKPRKHTHQRTKHKNIVVQMRKPNHGYFGKQLVPAKHTYGLKCDRCGATEKLTAHHKVARVDGGTNHPDNISILCVNCHMKEHK